MKEIRRVMWDDIYCYCKKCGKIYPLTPECTLPELCPECIQKEAQSIDQ